MVLLEVLRTFNHKSDGVSDPVKMEVDRRILKRTRADPDHINGGGGGAVENFRSVAI